MLSVIIAMSPGREKHLSYCLDRLRHNGPDLDLIIVDDGSEFGAEIGQRYQETFLRLEYLWRPNDRNLSRSRNLGAEAALGDTLLFMNCDVLLNPRALEAYRSTLSQYPEATIWGYIGCRKAVTAPSIWYPELRVNWLDFRFFPRSETQIWQHPDLSAHPYRLASGHHFALSMQTWRQVGPMNEQFVNWGEEDVEYALRALIHGSAMIFLGDAWAEHLHHDYAEVFHLEAITQKSIKDTRIQSLETQLSPLSPPLILFEQAQKKLADHIYHHYLKHDPEALESEYSRLIL